MIGIRVDCNETIGAGHLMRTLAIAIALKEMGEPCVFIMQDDVQLVKNAGFLCIQITREEVSQTIKIIKNYCINTLLIDSYLVTDEYFKRINSYAATAYMFDFGNPPQQANKIINYNITWDMYTYPTLAKCLLGCENMPLRKEFLHGEFIRDYTKATSLMITTGGSDSFNITEKLLNAITKDDFFCDISINVVIGKLNTFAKEIKKYSSDKINCICNAQSMREIMIQSDVCICAGGSTLYELCAMAVPTVAFAFAKNQEMAVKAFADKEIMLYGGIYIKEPIIEMIIANVKKLFINEELRKTLGERAKLVVSEDGAVKIGKFLVEETL